MTMLIDQYAVDRPVPTLGNGFINSVKQSQRSSLEYFESLATHSRVHSIESVHLMEANEIE